MANITISPNMNMPIPVVGMDPGPDWATNVVSCLNIIDAHQHVTLTSGVPITPAGINITADLPFNSNNATLLRSTRFVAQSAPLSLGSDIGCLYVSGVDLYYNDESGNQVRITQSGSVTGASGTITGLPSGTASASYSAGTFTFQSATNTPATLSVGSVVVGQQVASGYGVTLSANASQAANFGVTFPAALPGALSLATLDSSGNLNYNSSAATGTLSIYTGSTGGTFSIDTSSTLGVGGVNSLTMRENGFPFSSLQVVRTGSANPVGAMNLADLNGVTYHFWVDVAGKFRISTNSNDIGTTGGTVVGTQS